MAVMQMQRVSICALKRDRKAILEKLQTMGVMEMTQVLDDESGFEKMDTQGARTTFEKKANLADLALDILQEYAPEKKSLLSSLEGKKLIEKETYNQVAVQKEEMMDIASRITGWQKEIAECRANIQKMENQIEALAPWMSLDVPMNFEGTGSTSALIGAISGEMTLEAVYSLIAEYAPEAEGVDVTVLSADRDSTYIVVLCLKKNAQQVEDALRQGGFARPSQIVSEIPAVEKEHLEAEISALQKEIEGCQKHIIEYGDKRADLRLISDYFRTRAEKYELLGQIPQSSRTFFVSGYIPKKAVPAVKKAMEEGYDLVFDVEEIQEDEEAPVLLSNNAFSQSVEGVLESYGLPKKGEVDPTTIMSFFYVFFFGLMLSDAAYGLIIFLACFIVLRKYPRMSQGMHKALKMFMYCGLSTLVWGVLFGGYFGDAVDVVARTFFHVDVPDGGLIKAAWFVPLNDPMRLLMYAMLFGVIHLFMGLALKGYMLLKDKQYMDFFCDVIIWYVFLIGLVMMLLPSSIFASISQLPEGTFPPAVSQIGKVMAIAGAVGLLLMSGRANKNIALRLALGAYDIYNVTGWLSDVLSYSRLLALGLATGVIASVVNQMASMLGDGIIAAVGFIVIFIVGHSLNLAINLLGAYVHTNRLQFVEFFGKFYEGGGRPFNPFKLTTKYVDVKEETYL